MLTSANHPTWPLRILCTAVLVAASAIFACRFAVSELKLKSIIRSVAALVACGTAGALLIHGIYDSLLGPDPRRFTLASNIAMDIAFVLVNTVVAAVVAYLLSGITGVAFWRADRGPRETSNETAQSP